MFSTLAIVGVGLIGGSVGLAAKKRKLVRKVVGIGRNEATLAKAKKLGAIDVATTDLAEGVREADLIVVCTPVQSIADFVLQAAQFVRPGAILTDAGSTKERIVKQVEVGLKRQKSAAHFVGSHPMAGSEKNGAEHGRADLFQDRAVILTPTKSTNAEAAERVEQYWQALGARIYKMSPAEHDRAVAAVSHVPHVIASALAAGTPEDYWPLVAGGWLDTTRIAGGDPELWRQILLENRSHTLKGLVQFEKVLSALRASLESESEAKLLKLLQAGKNARDAVGSRYSAS